MATIMAQTQKPTLGTSASKTKSMTPRQIGQQASPSHGEDSANAPRYNQRVLGSFVTCILAMATSGSGSFTPSVLIGTTWNVSAPVTLLVFFVASVVTAVEIGKMYWRKFVRQVDDVVLNVSSSQALTRIKSSMSASSLRIAKFANHIGSKKNDTVQAQQRSLVIASKDPYLATQEVAKLSLADLGNIVRFVSDMNRLDFNREAFFSGITKEAQTAATALSKAMVDSRGSKVVMSTQPIGGGEASRVENMDALGFLAMTRLFAEWRALRLVPEGYKRYAVGMGLAKRDLVQNIQKTETAVHNYLAQKESTGSAAVDYANGRQLSSPTIKQLLLWEKEQNIHTRLPKLTEKSGASGLLWIQRQLQYQATTFQNLALVPVAFPTAKEAVAAAYISTYEPYHGFIVKQMFQHSFEAAPDVAVIMNQMSVGGGGVSANKAPRQQTHGDGEDEATVLTSIEEDSAETATATKSSVTFADPVPSDMILMEKDPVHILVSHISEEWIKFEQFLNQCKGHDKVVEDRCSPRNAVAVPQRKRKGDCEKGSQGRLSASQKAAEEEIPSFVAVFQPMLDGLDTLVSDLNMKDPSKC